MKDFQLKCYPPQILFAIEAMFLKILFAKVNTVKELFIKIMPHLMALFCIIYTVLPIGVAPCSDVSFWKNISFCKQHHVFLFRCSLLESPSHDFLSYLHGRHDEDRCYDCKFSAKMLGRPILVDTFEHRDSETSR